MYNDLLVDNLRFSPFYPPQSRIKPSQGCVPVWHSVWNLLPKKTTVPRLPDGEYRVILQSLVLSQYQRVISFSYYN